MKREREDGFSNAGGDVGSAISRMNWVTNNTADQSSLDAGEGRFIGSQAANYVDDVGENSADRSDISTRKSTLAGIYLSERRHRNIETN
jgi:hypothetical protein